MAYAKYIPVLINAAKNGTRDLVAAPGAGKQIWVYGLYVLALAIGTVTFIDDTPTNLSGLLTVTANQTICLPATGDGDMVWMKCSTNKKLQVTLSADTDLDGWLIYAVVDIRS